MFSCISVKSGRTRQVFAGLTGGLCLLIAGNWTGWISPFLHRMEKGEEVPFNLTLTEKSWVVALPDLMNILFSIPAGYIMDELGRKPAFFITAIFFQLSWILTIFANGAILLYAARILCGVGLTITYTVVPMYLAEIAETEIRGAISALFTVLLWGGNLFVSTLALFIPIKTTEIISAFIPLIFFILLIFIPESPHYLLMKNKHKKAYQSYCWLRSQKSDEQECANESKVPNELDDINKQIQKEMESRGRWIDLISTKGTRRSTIIVLTISAMQRFSGINVMLSYMSTTLPSNGGGLDPDECVIFFGLLLMTTSIGSMFIIDRLGRKPALYASGIICSILQGIIAYYFYSTNLKYNDTPSNQWIPYACMLVFAVFYQAGIGIISHTLLGEMFPANIKSKASAATNICFSISSFIIQKTFPIITQTYGSQTMFIIFATSNALSAIFTYFFVIETKGKTLGEIQDILNR